MSEASAEILDCHRNGTVFLDIQYQCRQKIVIPYPHQFQDRGRDNCWFQDRDQNLEVYLKRSTSIDQSRFLNFKRDTLYKSCKHKDRQTCTKSKIDNTNVVWIVQM